MKSWIRKACRNVLAQRGISLVRLPPILSRNPGMRLEVSFEFVLSHYLQCVQHVPFFLQIGAFNGVDGDPLYAYARRGLLRGCSVEPQADAFEQLCLNYAGNSNVILKHAAIGAQSGTATLFRIRPGTDGPSWLPQIASFHREVILSHAEQVPEIEQAIVTEAVAVVAFNDLIDELGVEPDVVVIDTEGHDFEIIKLMNIGVRKPAILLYEHKHLTPKDHEESIQLLGNAGYRLAIVKQDTLAYLSDNLQASAVVDLPRTE